MRQNDDWIKVFQTSHNVDCRNELYIELEIQSWS